ncbi:MAG: hypothetical protein KF757_11785 [Phycisphaeraceae bacterium]|nr:hypothetical protein [Phycisphaeraceae bacterium]MCW5762372.1 hypothetical protein [Phycisphaeraceae bacterium]
MTRRKTISAAALLLTAAVATGFSAMANKPLAQQEAATGVPQDDMGRMLIEGLKATPGCLGVDTAQTGSKKLVIIAWFKDARAARKWYYSPVHERMVKMAGGDVMESKPLEHVADNVPVMVLASLTPSDRPEVEGIPMPISQISIELYTPLPGGAAVGGRLAPDKFPVRHMNGYPEPEVEVEAAEAAKIP